MRPPARLALAAAVLAAALPVLAPAGQAGHVAVNESTFPWGACEVTCIPAIVQPRFAPPGSLAGDARVVGLVVDGDARAYPLDILVWHEIVNDVVGGKAVAVTYCPLCGSSSAYLRDAGGQRLTFQTSGRLHMNDLVMLDDETRSLWPQLLGEAVSGPLHGTRLEVLPSSVTTWGAWRSQHPESLLLARPTCSDWPSTVSGCPPGSDRPARDYGRDPYGDYASSRRIGITHLSRDDIGGLHPKTVVVGHARDGAAKAWPQIAALQAGVINDDVGPQPVVVAVREGTVRLFARDPGQRFQPHNATHMADQAGKAWDLATGTPAAGGPGLRELPTVTSFLFAWVDFHPGSAVHQALGLVGTEPAERGSVQGTQPVVMRFSHAVDPASLAPALRVEPLVALSPAWRGNATVALTPAEPWAPGQLYTITVEGLRTEAGQPLPPATLRVKGAEAGKLLPGFEPLALLAAGALATLAMGWALRRGAR